MSIIVGLDPSLRAAGIAIIRDPATANTPNVPELYVVGEGATDDVTLIGRANRIRRQRDRILKRLPAGVKLVMIEAIPKVNPTPKAASLFVERGALCLELAQYLGSKGVPVVDVGVPTIKLFATGNGHATKLDVMRAMKELWPRSPIGDNDNLSDALAVGTIGAQHLGWYQPEATHHWSPNVNWGGINR